MEDPQPLDVGGPKRPAGEVISYKSFVEDPQPLDVGGPKRPAGEVISYKSGKECYKEYDSASHLHKVQTSPQTPLPEYLAECKTVPHQSTEPLYIRRMLS